MIPRYTDHAANERTFLAWVRTALALVAFGSVLAKFDLFLRMASGSAVKNLPQGSGLTAELGIAFVTFGIVLFAAAYRRFCSARASIAAPEERQVSSTLTETALTCSMILLGIGVLVALLRTLAA